MTLTEEYTLLEKLGEGGFATVFKAQHNALGYVRAIRMLNAFVPNEADEVYQKFLKECKVLLRLGNGNHPNIVHIYQPRLVDCHALVEMDYVDGLDLIHYIQSEHGFVPLDEVLRMAEEMSSALAYCHHDIYRYCMDRKKDNLKTDPNDGSKVLIDAATERRLVATYKVIHNDIHSGNIMRRIDGHYMLLDFGLAIEGGDVVHSSRRKNGAPEYKAPEKWDNAGILTEQSDIYSFGIVMYEFLAGRVPFMYDKNNSNQEMAGYEVMIAHLKQAPPPIRPFREEAFRRNNPGKQYDEDYPQWLDDIIMRCLEKAPAKRFANGKELHEAIERDLSQMSKQAEKEISALKADLQHYKDVEQQQANALAQSQKQVAEMQRIIDQQKETTKGLQQSLTETKKHTAELKDSVSNLQQEDSTSLIERYSDLKWLLLSDDERKKYEKKKKLEKKIEKWRKRSNFFFNHWGELAMVISTLILLSYILVMFKK